MKTILVILLSLTLLSCEKQIIEEPIQETSQLKSASLNLMPNGGGQNTTDWKDSDLDGIADYWKARAGFGSTDAGINWTGRFQRIRSTAQFSLMSPSFPDDRKQYHRVTFKYRSNTKVTMVIMYNERCPSFVLQLEPTDKPQSISRIAWSPTIYTIKFYNHPNNQGWLELDEINVY